jgi:hypothetical protein
MSVCLSVCLSVCRAQNKNILKRCLPEIVKLDIAKKIENNLFSKAYKTYIYIYVYIIRLCQ